MEEPHILRTLLQIQLASDASAVEHLPYILLHLSKSAFDPSPQLSKWISRINALLRSNDPSVRWAGLCLAYKTSSYSQELMIDNAQAWIGVALPAIARNDAIPTVKAAIRLLRLILTAALDIPEFQRQLATPNATKFSVLLMDLADKNPNVDLKSLCLNSLATIICHYPTLHRQSHPALSSLALKYLNGSAPAQFPAPLVEAAAGLYCILPLTGGKVGAASLWKNSVDETLNFAWHSFNALRTSSLNGNARPPLSEDSETTAVSIPKHLDALHCATKILIKLLSSSTERPVTLSLGPLVEFALALLRCPLQEPFNQSTDSATFVMERSVIPSIWKLGCSLTSSLAQCTQHHLSPHVSRIIYAMIYHLEQTLVVSQRLSFITTVRDVLDNTLLMNSDIAVTRLVRCLLPPLTIIFARETSVQTIGNAHLKSKKGKRRAREFEGDELLRTSRVMAFPTTEDGEVALATIETLELLSKNPHISPPVRSLASRIFIAISLALPQISPAKFCPDLTLHARFSLRLRALCAGLCAGLSDTMSTSLPLALQMGRHSDDWDLLLHPRLPPLFRAVPYVDAFSMFRMEENQEEIDAREAMSITTIQSPVHSGVANHLPLSLITEDKLMQVPDTSTTIGTVRQPMGHENHASTTQNPQKPTLLSAQPSSPLPTSSGYTPPRHLSPPVRLAVKPQRPVTFESDPPPEASPSSGVLNHRIDDEDEDMPSINMDSDSD